MSSSSRKRHGRHGKSSMLISPKSNIFEFLLGGPGGEVVKAYSVGTGELKSTRIG